MHVAAPSNRPEPTTATPARTPNPPRPQPLQLALILVAAFMVVLDFSIVNVALPSIERELHMPADAVQWIVTGYAISFGGLLILGGRAADLLGRPRMFVVGLVAFALASLAARAPRLTPGAVTPAAFAVAQAVPLGWTSPLVIAAAATAAAAAAFFVKAETRHPAPLIRPALLHRKGLRDGTTLAFLLGLWN